jgi:hypothetical protein
MGYNAKQFAEHANLKSSKIIKKWFEAGYLGKSSRNERGVYDIPFDTPVPFLANSRVKKNSVLWEQLLMAADNNQSVFKSMFPLITEENFNRQLNLLVSEGFIEIIQVNTYLDYLSLRPNGFELLQKLSDNKQRKSILYKLNSAISASKNITSIMQVLTSLGIFIATDVF